MPYVKLWKTIGGELDKVDKNNRTSKLGYRSAGNRSKANDFWPY